MIAKKSLVDSQAMGACLFFLFIYFYLFLRLKKKGYGQTDTPSYKDARTQPKMHLTQSIHPFIRQS